MEGRDSPSSSMGRITATFFRKPKRHRNYGNGTELDDIEDLQIDRDQESRFRVTPLQITHRIPGAFYPNQNARKATLCQSNKGMTVVGLETDRELASRLNHSAVLPKLNTTKVKNKPTLIRNLNKPGPIKVVGGMRWNPQSMRWDGNEQILRDFDAIAGNSSRPALITHLTSSLSATGSSTRVIPPGMRVVGNMIFDPDRMCWLPKEASEDDEVDPFAGIDDNDDPGTVAQVADSHGSLAGNSSGASESESETVSIKSGVYGREAVRADPAFKERCLLSERVHQQDIVGWVVSQTCQRNRLQYIRDLATKRY